MKIRRFFGKDMREALKQVKDELGGDAVIMSNKKVADGVELVAAVDPGTDTVNRSDEHSMPTPQPQNNHASRQSHMANNHAQMGGKATPSLSEIIGDSGPDSLQALLEAQMKKQSAQSSEQQSPEQQASRTNQNSRLEQAEFTNQSQQTDSQSQSLHYSQQANYGKAPDARADERIFRSPAFIDEQDELNVEDNQASGIQPPPSVLEPEQLDKIKAELESIKNVLKFQVSELTEERKKRNNPVHHYLHEQLIQMGISASLAKQFIEFLPHKVDEKQGWKYILNLLSNRLHVGGNDILSQSGVVALVGPTGTGKTTTLAKLAAKYAQKYGSDQVAMITVDTYRIAAYEQLATYGRIIGCTVKKAHNSQELNEVLYQLRNKKLVLIDTAGFSQRDSRLISQINDYEHGVNADIRKYLVLPAGAQYQVLKQTIMAYQSIHLSGCIFSKLDECYSLGEALSVAIENDLSLSYVTDGQRVPEDIKLADSANLTLIAAKLYKKYGAGMDASAGDLIAGGL